jgi:hypothetical protein
MKYYFFFFEKLPTQKKVNAFNEAGLELGIESEQFRDGMGGHFANIGTHVTDGFPNGQHHHGGNHLDTDG